MGVFGFVLEATMKPKTPAFKRWFGNSAIVDAEGRPQVLYHQTRQDFTTFIPGGWLPDLSGRAIWLTAYPHDIPSGHNVMATDEGARVLPVYARIERPLYITDADEAAFANRYKMDSFAFPMTISDASLAALRRDGYDGIVYAHWKSSEGFDLETGRNVEVIAFDPTQIKSATGNRGTWDPTDPDIRHNPKTARRTHPSLWSRIVAEVTASAKGGLPGQWSARKAQFAVAEYKRRGGGYIGPKAPDNALAKWTREQWRTRSGLPSLVTGERYLPAKALAALSPQEYGATTRAKRAGMAAGQQFVPQPERIAMKTAKYRKAKRNPNYDDVSVYRGVLTSPEGRIPVKQIGKGQFSVAYLSSEPRPRVFLFTSEEVQDKEILMFAHDRLPNNPHLPAVEQYGHARDGRTVWTMPLYKAPLKKADNEQAWKQYIALKKCREALYRPKGVKSGYQVNYDVYECAVAAGVSPKLANALEHLISTAADYDEEYVFEFSPRNLATDAEGNLVLLDVLYHRRALFRALGAAAKRGF